MRLISFRTRVFLLVVAVAAITATATAYITAQQTTEQLTRSTALAQQDMDHVVADITLFGLVRADCWDVGGLVVSLAERTGQRVRLLTADSVIADSDPAAATVPPRQSVLIDTRPAPHLGDVDLRLRAQEAVHELYAYRGALEIARCWENRGVQFRAAKAPPGMYEFVQTGPGRPVSCVARAYDMLDIQQEAAALVAPCAPALETACIQRGFVERLGAVTPAPVWVFIRTADTPPPLKVNLKPVLAAAVLLALIAVAVSLLISRRVLRPVGALATASQRLGEGNLAAERVPERGHDELTKLTRSFNRMAESLQRSKEQQHNIISDVAHELRTPLANIRCYLEALKDGVFPPEPALFRSLYEEALLQQRLIDDLQELALAESGSLVYNPVESDLSELLVACRTAHAPVAAVQDIRIETDCPAPVRTLVDPERFRQVIGNLITNAVRSTPAGGVITLRSHAERGFAVAEVADTGSGISADDLPHVFDRFWRADAARGRGTGGRGLGLAIAREIIAAHDGTITAASPAGSGTVFVVRLPLVR